MNTIFIRLALCLSVTLNAAEPKANLENNTSPQPWEPRLQKYFVTKEHEARSLAKQLNLQVAPEVWEYFDAGTHSDWTRANKIFDAMSRTWRQQHNATAVSAPVMEAVLAYEGFTGTDMKFVELFARDIIDSIPRGSIYFGGTDPGRGLVTAFCKSFPDADPFFVLSQNPLADKTYLQYLQATYGKRLYIPSDADLKQAHDDYVADATARMKEDKLKPGEELSEDADGKLEPKSNVAIMEVNARLAKMIFDKNPRHEFYVEESMPMDWMYPHVSPHGLILKLHRQLPARISDETIQEDRRFWRAQTSRLIGDWLTNETPVAVLCEFLEQVYGQGLLDRFKADPAYVLADPKRSAHFVFGHLRLGQAHVYEWRMNNATSPEEKQRMTRELDLAYRQSIALSPKNVETIKRYVTLLIDQKRGSDARRMLEAGRRLNPRSTRLQQLADELKEP